MQERATKGMRYCEIVHESTRNIILISNMGCALMMHGCMSTRRWLSCLKNEHHEDGEDIAVYTFMR